MSALEVSDGAGHVWARGKYPTVVPKDWTPNKSWILEFKESSHLLVG